MILLIKSKLKEFTLFSKYKLTDFTLLDTSGERC